MKKVALAIIAVFALGSCNTMIGVGRDFSQLGKGMENKAHGKNFNDSESQQSQDNLPTY